MMNFLVIILILLGSVICQADEIPGQVNHWTLDNNKSNVDLGDIDSLGGTSPFSVSFWFNFTQIPSSGWGRFVSKEGRSNGRQGWDFIFAGKDGRINFERWRDGKINAVSTKSDTTFYTDTWYYVVGTYDGSRMMLFVNGTLVGKIGRSNLNISGNNDHLTVGYGQGNQLKGVVIRDLRIYNRAISMMDIRRIYVDYLRHTLKLFEKTGDQSPQVKMAMSSIRLPWWQRYFTSDLNSDKPVMCRSSIIPGQEFDLMFDEGVSPLSIHPKVFFKGLETGGQYHFYVKCKDAADYVSKGDIVIPVSVEKDITLVNIAQLNVRALDDGLAFANWVTTKPTDTKLMIDQAAGNIHQEYMEEGLSQSHPILLKDLKQGSAYAIKAIVKDEAGHTSVKKISFQYPLKPSVEFFVSSQGNDANPGTKELPFASLERARDVIRIYKEKNGLPIGGIQVWLRQGRYRLTKPFTLSMTDSGTEQSPIHYSGYPGEHVTISGGIELKYPQAVNDPDILKLLTAQAVKHVVVYDLRSLGIVDYGDIQPDNMWKYNPKMEMELFFNGKPMDLPRWPKDGWLHLGAVNDSQALQLPIKEDLPQPSWQTTDDTWVYGCFHYNWFCERLNVTAIDTVNKEMTVAHAAHYGYQEGRPFYFFNVLEELNGPGEWYMDRVKGKLYFWPPEDIKQGEVVISLANELIKFNNDTADIIMDHLNLEYARSYALELSKGAHDVALHDIKFRHAGGHAIRGSNIDDVAVFKCVFEDLGSAAVMINNDVNQITLTGGRVAIFDNILDRDERRDQTANGNIILRGVNDWIAYNRIFDLPYDAIAFSGNNTVIEHNEIFDVVKAANDGGGIYIGRHWGFRGNVIRYNDIHDIHGLDNQGAAGIYLDDTLQATRVYGNMLSRIQHVSDGGAIKIGGGRDTLIYENIFSDCPWGIRFDVWHTTGPKTWEEDLAWQKSELQKVNYLQAPYITFYPELANVLDEDPYLPKGATFVNNAFYNTPDWFNTSMYTMDDIILNLSNPLTVKNNFITKESFNKGHQPADIAALKEMMAQN